jgi:predicted dehydrogenase
MNRAQYARLASLAEQNGVVLMEAMWTRYLPATRYFKEELLPRIGDVKRVYAEFSFPIVSPDLSHGSRFLDKQAGAGSLLDQGVYALTWADLALNGLEGTNTTTEVTSLIDPLYRNLIVLLRVRAAKVANSVRLNRCEVLRASSPPSPSGL